MIGVIAAAGEGTRLGQGVKALVPLRGRYLIEYPLGNMKGIGLTEVVIIEKDKAVSSVLGSEYRGMSLSYVEQKERKGIAHAIAQTEPLVGKQDMFIMFSDIIYRGHDLIRMKERFIWNRESNYILYGIKRVPNKNLIKQSYGMETRPGRTTIKIIEKPKKVKHLMPFIGLGIYVANHRLFRAIEMTAVSDLRNEIEITDTLNLMAQALRASGHILNGMYANINTPVDFQQVSQYLGKNRK